MREHDVFDEGDLVDITTTEMENFPQILDCLLLPFFFSLSFFHLNPFGKMREPGLCVQRKAVYPQKAAPTCDQKNKIKYMYMYEWYRKRTLGLQNF